MFKVEIFFTFFLLFLISNCATILKGYNDNVSLINAPEDLKIETNDGVNIPILKRQIVKKINNRDNTIITLSYYIYLRSNQSHTLRLKSADFEKTIVVYPKMSAGWLILDTITGIIPIIFDMYTGCFNHFDDIHFDIE